MAKKATWLRLLLTKLGLLKVLNQYVEIKVIWGNTEIKQILSNIKGQKKEAIPPITSYSELKKAFIIKKVLSSKTITNFPLLLKINN